MAKSNELTRRSFLATTALAAGGLAVAAAAGCSSVDTAEPEPEPEPEAAAPEPAAPEASAEEESAPAQKPDEQIFISTCRGNCGGKCALEGVVREGKLVSTFPMRYPREDEGLQVGCMKGVTNPMRIYGPARVQYPMKRVGDRGSGEWEQITWDEALDLVAEKFNAAIADYGPSSICWQVGAGNMYAYLNSCNTSFTLGYGVSRIAQKIGATMLSVGDDMAGIYFNLVYLTTPNNALEDIVNAKTIIAWGANPAEASFCRSAWHWISKAKEGGAKLITLDPLYTSTAAHSDEWVPVRTGTDAALMCAMANYIVKNDLANWDYVKNKSIAPFLIDEAGAYLRLSAFGKAEAGADDDIPVVWDEDAQDFVAHTEATNPAINGTFDANGVSVRTVFDAAMESIAPFDTEFAAKECGLPAEQIERLALTAATEGPTTYYVNYGLEHTYESWRVYFLIGLLASLTGSVGVPGGSYRGSIGLDHSTATRWKAPVTLDLSGLSIGDEKVPSKVITGDWLVPIMETGQWAGEDFPVRALIIETCNPLDNFSGPTDILAAYNKIDFVVTVDSIMTTTAHYSDLILPAAMSWESEEFMQGGLFCQKGIEPIGEARSDFDICKGIAEHMGFTDLYPQEGLDYLRDMLDTPENLEAGVGFDAYYENGVILGDYTVNVHQTPEFNKFGRTQFYMEYLWPRDNFGQFFDTPDRLPTYKPSIEAYADNPDRAKYPLYGFSNHDLYHGQSMWIHNPFLDDFRTVDGKPFCRIHTNAAAERGIKTGDDVRIYNDHGTCVLKALVTPGIREDSIWVPHGFAWDEFDEGFAQSLSRWCPDDVTSNANFNDWICEVEKL